MVVEPMLEKGKRIATDLATGLQEQGQKISTDVHKKATEIQEAGERLVNEAKGKIHEARDKGLRIATDFQKAAKEKANEMEVHGRQMMNDMHEGLELLEAVREEVGCMEIPPPIHYPPSPPGDIDIFSMLEPKDKELEIEDQPLSPIGDEIEASDTPLLPLRTDGEGRQEDGPRLPASYSFACGGWLQFWLWGVAKCIMDFDLLHPEAKVAGCSAGALTAVGMLLPDSSFERAMEFCKNVAIPKCRGTLKGPFQLDKYVRGCLEVSASLNDHWHLVKGRLLVATTKLPEFRCERISEFSSVEDLEDSLVASAAAFPLAPPVKRRGGKKEWLIDGGLTDFQPVFNKHTITINPFYFSQADVKPSRYIPAWWAVLPSSDPNTLDWLYDLGYCDMLRWMEKNGHNSYQKYCTDPKDIMTCSRRPPRQPHPFDVSNKSFRRFFGYGDWPFFVDAFTNFLVSTIWRSMAFTAIYGELTVKLLLVAMYAAFHDLHKIWPFAFMAFFLFFPSAIMVIMANVILVFIFTSFFKSHVSKHWRQVAVLAASLFSVSLWLRSIPFFGERIHLRKHHRLFRQSFFYRLTLHML